MAERKKHMFVVDFWEDIEKNFQTLEKYKNSEDTDERKFYNNLILNGICFLVIRVGDRVLFGPSRFVGYYDNTIMSHKISKIFGPETNEAISFLIGYDPIQDVELDELYFKFCSEIGLNARASGSFGASRKYWYKSNVDDPVYMRFEDFRINNKKIHKVKINFDPTYESWKIDMTGMTSKLITGEITVPLLNHQKVEVHGNIVSELKGRFEWYADDHSYFVAINKWDEMNKEQGLIILRNVRTKLKEVIPEYLKNYD